MTVFIYCLCDPRDGKIRYVGKARNLRKRFLSHLWEQKRTDRKTNWVKHLNRLGLIPSVEVLEIIETAPGDNREANRKNDRAETQRIRENENAPSEAREKNECGDLRKA